MLLWKTNAPRRNRYFQELREKLFTQALHLRHWRPSGHQLPRVGIPAAIWNLGPWESRPRDFLLHFLKRLGVEVVQDAGDALGEAGPLAAVKGEIIRLQEKADVVLLPMWQGLGEAALKLKELPQELAQETMARFMALEFSPACFYTACMELGLCFRKRLSGVRRIYFQTLAEVGGEI